MKRELLDNGNIWQKSDGRWIGMVRYKDEFGVAQRKSFSSKKKKTLQAKMTEYVKNFNEQVTNSDEACISFRRWSARPMIATNAPPSTRSIPT